MTHLRQIILDTETTGLSNKDRVIELGCIELINRKRTDKNFHYYFNPECAIGKEAFKVHGISESFLADKPKFSEIAEKWLRWIEGAELIAHNASFDIRFLNAELSRAGASKMALSQEFKVIDTLLLARRKHPGQKNSLDALCKRYGINNRRRKLHGALLDADLLAEVYLVMTGVQRSLFTGLDALMQSNEEQNHTKEANPQRLESFDTPVWNANTAEKEAHAVTLSHIAKQRNKTAIWGNAQEVKDVVEK